MPLRAANIGDTVSYRDAKGKTRNVTVTGTQSYSGTAPSAPAVANSGAGGTLTAATYSYRITRIKQGGAESPASSAGTTVVGAGSTNKCTITLPGVAGEKYGIYGRTGGSELFIGVSAVGASSFDDTGSVTPAGAVPGSDSRISGYSHHQNTQLGSPGASALVLATGMKQTGKYFNR
jgi:hypothetical protein